MVTTLPLRQRVRARTREGTSSASPVDRHAHAAKHRIPDSEFIIKDSYLDEYRYSDWFERAGLEMTFHSQHRPLERYSRALEQAGMVIEAIREHRVPDHVADKPAARRWQRLPLFMHIRAFKLAR
jgi:hypothetical protein